MLEFLLWILSTCPHSEHNVPPIQNASPQLVPVRQVQVGDVSCRGHDGFKTRRSMLIWGWTWGNHWWWPEKGSQKEKDVYQNWHFWQFKKNNIFQHLKGAFSFFNCTDEQHDPGIRVEAGDYSATQKGSGPFAVEQLKEYALHTSFTHTILTCFAT